MRLEQHLYTSGKTEFTTIAATDGLNRQERLELERHSLYLLPAARLYQENAATPLKYVYYALGEDRIVVGKAMYIGQDSLGRPGNYLFHNMILAQDDLWAFSGFNPVPLIRVLEKKGLFQKTVPSKPITVVECSLAPIDIAAYHPPAIPQDLLEHLVSVCLGYESLQLPLLLNGTAQACLDFLECLYPLLPYHLRPELSFDTYSYNVNLGFRIQALPDDPEFRQNLSPSLTLSLGNLKYRTSLTSPQPSKRLALMTQMISAGKLVDLNALYSLEYDLQNQDYDHFNEKYHNLPQEMKEVMLDFHKDTLLHHIAADRDTELLRLIQEQISDDDLAILASSPDLLTSLLDSDFSHLSAIRQRNVLHIILQGVFSSKDPGEIHRQLRDLFEKAEKTHYPLLLLLSSIEQVERSKKGRKVLQEILTRLPQDHMSPEATACIQRLLKPPSSFFKRISEILKDM